jgi:hypothetical protein
MNNNVILRMGCILILDGPHNLVLAVTLHTWSIVGTEQLIGGKLSFLSSTYLWQKANCTKDVASCTQLVSDNYGKAKIAPPRKSIAPKLKMPKKHCAS